MADLSLLSPDEQWFRKRLQWLMLSRVAVASFFLGMAAITQIQRSDSLLGPQLVWIYGLTLCVYVCSLVYVLALAAVKKLRLFAALQIAVDLLFVTVLLFVSGGVNSIFSFMYSIEIIAASILLYLSGGLATATSASLLYGAVVVLQQAGVIVSPAMQALVKPGYSGAPLYFPIIVNTSAFYLVALLSSFLAEQTRKSRQKVAEQQLDIRNLEALNEHIIQSITSGLMTLDLEKRIVTCNQAAREITGLSFDQVHMHMFERVFPALDLSLQQFYEAGRSTPLRVERKYVRPEGTELYLGFSISALKNSAGAAIGTIIAFQDLTGFRELQASIRRMDRLAAVGRLAAGIAHEVRNPLASISGSVQVLRKGLSLSPSDKRLMDIIIQESDNLSELIADFTRFARPVSREKSPVAVKAVVDEVVEMFRNSPDCSDDIVVASRLREGVVIEANRQQFRQVIWNLVINAAQAITGSGSIEIDARTRETGFVHPAHIDQLRAEQGDSWVELKVRDTGAGIPQSDIERIFDPFYTTKDRGFGLGLSIVYKIVEEHGGLIVADSTPGQGTAFFCYFIRSVGPGQK